MCVSSTLAKIAAPQMGKVYPRKRLFTQLDQARRQPIIWISAPAGFGKTTLVANYLKEQALPCLWYQLDSGDGDIASFFYYLGLAGKKVAPRRRKPLPLLTPEYMPGLPTFTRNFFRDLFGRIKAPGVLVFDNYQDVPADAPLHQLMAEALQEVPEGINVIIVSRLEPPAAFTRLQANQSLIQLEASKLAFSMDETKGLVRLFDDRAFSAEAIEAIHKRFDGWCAGMILQLQQGIDTSSTELEQHHAPISVFNYLAIEVFNRWSVEEQDVLLKSALLPHMSIALLEPLTGNNKSAEILAELNQQNYFTALYSSTPLVYQYHALFREFLLDKGKQFFSEKESKALQKRAAELLLTEDKFEEAAVLFEEAGAHEAIVGLILKYAPLLMEQGRFLQLQGLVEKLPEEMQKQPWVRYWQATAMLPFDLKASYHLYEQALHAFEKTQQRDGMFLSWVGIVDSIVITWDDYEPLSHWIAWMDTQLAEDPVIPNTMIEARVMFGMFCSLMFHQPLHPDMPIWEQRVDTLLEQLSDDNRRINIANHYITYLCWLGEFKKAAMVLERLRPCITSDKTQTINLIAWQLTETIYHWVVGDFETSNTFIQTGLDLSGSSGVHILDFMFLVQRLYAQSDSTTVLERECNLNNVRAIMDNGPRAGQSNYYYMAALDAALRRDPQRALIHLDKALELIRDFGLPFPYALYTMAKARILTELDRFDEARHWLTKATEIASGMKSKILEFSAYLAEAELAFAQNDEVAGIGALTRAMSLGKSKHYLHIDWWRPYAMLALCLKALEHNIEVDYVQELIRRRNLNPASPPLHLGNWPWQVKIYTLGRFSVVLDDKPIDAKGRGKPLALLKVLIALGGRDVSEARITEALWPDAEGDVAHSAFTSTLSRLRKLLCTDALIVRDGLLSLNDRLCWLDTWAFERLLGETEQLLSGNSAEVEKIQQHQQKVFALYHGDFLDKQSQMSWVLGPRERLRLKLLRVIKLMISFFGQQGQCQQVIALYEKALELDQLAEEYYRGLVQCYAGMGDRAKALQVYKTCETLFNNNFNLEPSEKTQQLYKKIKEGDTEQLAHLCDSCH